MEFCVDADEYSLKIGFEQYRTELAEWIISPNEVIETLLKVA